MIGNIIYIFVFVTSVLLNIKWVYHMLKAIPLTRSGNVDKTHLKIALKWIIIAVLFFIMVQVFIRWFNFS